MRALRFLVLILCGFGAVLMMTTSAASAHNTFVDSSPREGDVLAAAPSQWRISFDKSVPLESATASIVNGDGVRTSLAAARHGETDTIIVFDLPLNLNGTITARWRLVGTDGHVISDRVSFTVGSAGTNTPAANTPGADIDNATTISEADESSGVPEPIRVSLRLLNYAAIVLLGGLLFVHLNVAHGVVHTATGRGIVRWSGGGLAVVPLVQFFVFINDISLPGASLFASLGDALATTAGSMLLLRAVIGVVLGVALAGMMQRQKIDQATLTVVMSSAAMYLIALAYVGHSRSESLPIVGVPLNVVHTSAVAIWLGGLVVLIAVVNPLVTTSHAITAFSRFGFAAQRAVIVIAATGTVQTLRLHGVSLSIITSAHGLLLLTKIAVVAAMVWLAAHNRRILSDPRLSHDNHAARARTLLVRTTTTEVVAGLIVISLTAILVAVSPS